ncbi:MAG TPA: MoxR family ATPase [Acidimicrobiales bacterium]|nr:MoxR family ATPase [Acidimicrobiales bacterium]
MTSLRAGGPLTASGTASSAQGDTAPAHDLAGLAGTFEAVVDSVRRAYVGKDLTVRLAICCLVAEGHLLVEDHPGVGKTTLAKALARSLGLGFGRVQFTADLLPADVTGAVVLDRDSGHLVFRPGPVFTNVLLADELNRASPKAQSALLEAMEERQVSVDGTSHPLPRPFMVLATQNPYDAAGTFPLPQSQRDRFLIRLELGYPEPEAEDDLLAGERDRPSPEALAPVGDPGFVEAFRSAAAQVHVAPEVRRYMLDIVHATRSHPDVSVGASPRAGLALLRASSTVAVARGLRYVSPDDVKLVAEPVLGHRLVVHAAADLAGVTASATVHEVLSRLVVPVGPAR